MPGHLGEMLMSVEHTGGRVSTHYRHGGLEVMVVEVRGGESLVDSMLWAGSSWHLVLDGQALFRSGERSWDLLPQESLHLDAAQPYAIVNPSPGRLRLLSIIAGDSPTETGGAA